MDGAQIIKNAVDPYWFFANEISKDTCQKIIDLGKKKWKKATVQTNFNSENQYDENPRKKFYRKKRKKRNVIRTRRK